MSIQSANCHPTKKLDTLRIGQLLLPESVKLKLVTLTLFQNSQNTNVFNILATRRKILAEKTFSLTNRLFGAQIETPRKRSIF